MRISPGFHGSEPAAPGRAGEVGLTRHVYIPNKMGVLTSMKEGGIDIYFSVCHYQLLLEKETTVFLSLFSPSLPNLALKPQAQQPRQLAHISPMLKRRGLCLSIMVQHFRVVCLLLPSSFPKKLMDLELDITATEERS